MSHEANSHRFTAGDEPIPGYRLIECIGRGGYGEVWKTAAPGGVSKAVKLIFDDTPAHGTTKLLAMNRIKDVRHPFLLSIERIEHRAGLLAVVTELADGNLQQHCQKYREKGLPGIPQNELLAMLRDVADVLDFIYQEYALQHLDIKAANLLVFGKRLKAGDFGLVKNIYERSTKLINGMTPAYAAPEIYGGKPSSDSDQYSLAIVYMEMLTGTLPFADTSASRLAMQHLHETPNLKALPVEQQPIIARALSKDPQHRFPSCTALIDELTAACNRAFAAEPDPGQFRVMYSPIQSAVSAEGGAPTPARQVVQPTASTVAPSPTRGITQAVPGLDPVGDELLSPTLVIGLGGTAGRLLKQLRQRLFDRLGEGAAAPAFQMLFIDSDAETITQIEREHRDQPGFKSLLTPLLASSDYRTKGQKHRRWLSRRWLFNIPRSLRTDGLRPLGRLALLSHPGAVKATLRSSIQQLAKIEPICVDGRRVAGPPRVLIVSSISGGTGSGMLLDIAYAARAELQLSGLVQGTVEGLLLHSTPLGADRDKAILNAVATLQELAHYSRPGKFYPGEPFLDIPPFHGNNCTFSRVQIMHLGDQLESHQWLPALDDAAEHVFTRLTTPRHAFGRRDSSDSDAGLTLEAVQMQQIGAYSGSFIADLSRQLCIDIIRGWCGLALKPAQGGNRSSQHATEMIQTILEQDEQTKYQDLIDRAPLKIHETGVDLEQLVIRAREMLVQELATDQRSYLQSVFQQAAQAAKVEKPDHELAGLVLSLQDRAIGLDFGERPSDPNRNTLFDLLHSRLASQAMQLSSKFTAWIHELVDDPEAGVEAARCAAESGRDYLSDLVGSMAKEIHEIHKQQIESRILLTSPSHWGDAIKPGRWWPSKRSQQHDVLEQQLVEHGLLCLEELALVCVQLQLQAVVAQSSAVIDKLNCFGHDLKQFASQFAAESRTQQEPGNAPAESERALQQLLLEHRHRLVRELRRQIDQQVLSGPKKLQRFLTQGCSLDQQLWLPLQQHARGIVLQSTWQVLLILLQHGRPAGDVVQFDLDAILDQYLSEPMPWAGDASTESFLVMPSDAASAQIERRLSAAGYNVQAVSAPINNISVCRIARAVSLDQVIAQIALQQPALIKLAESLHARTDVAWGSTGNAPAADPQFSAALADAEQGEFAGTLCLSQLEADE